MYGWLLLAVLVIGIAIVLRVVRPRDDFLRLPRPPRNRDLTATKR